MTGVSANLTGAAWLESAGVRAVFAALAVEDDAVRVVGGAVRNALMGRPVADVDFATTATPDKVGERAAGAGIKVVPTGIEHGTVTLVVGGRGFEVTTLREDIETDGRRAVVRFGRDWLADARRRDFTVNALSVEANGKIHDPLGGYEDILARRIRFIGDPDRRIAEDRLRILRLFRFHAEYGVGELDREGLSAAIRARDGLRALSAERVGQEMRRLAVAPGAPDSAGLMQDAGILPIVLGGVGYIGALRRLADFEKLVGLEPDVVLRLAGLGTRIAEDVVRLTTRLRLSNAERDRMEAAVMAAGRFDAALGDELSRRLLYQLGPRAWRDGLGLSRAWGRRSVEAAEAERLFGLPDRWQVPRFPLTGRDVLGGGTRPGPSVGTLLRAVEDWWVASDFKPDEAELRRRLQQMIAAEQ